MEIHLEYYQDLEYMLGSKTNNNTRYNRNDNSNIKYSFVKRLDSSIQREIFAVRIKKRYLH